jgi:SAM-dependent methyltransferase
MSAPAPTLLSTRFSSRAGPAVPVSAQQRECIEVVNAQIASGAYRLREDPCPCGAAARDATIAEVDRYGLPLRNLLCLGCGTLRASPYLDAGSLADFYTKHYQRMYARSNDAVAYFSRQQIYGRRMLAHAAALVPPGATALEVGCGAGGAVKLLQDAGYRMYGCDFARDLLEHGKRGGVGGLHYGGLDDVIAAQPGVRFDLICLHHVFEHLVDPLAFLRLASASLAPQGAVLIAVPDVSRIDTFAFPAGDLRLFLHLAHRFNFTEAGLQRLAMHAGLQTRRLHGAEATEAPEMWLAFIHASAQQAAAPMPLTEAEVTADASDGAGMLLFLQTTERRFALGLTRAQIAATPQRIVAAARALVPALLRARVKHLLRRTRRDTR